jgi:hypothetical protein
VGIERKLRLLTIAVSLLAGGTAGIARPQGSLVLAPATDAQPYFVPPATEVKLDPADEAIQQFRRAISEAAVLQQQRIQASCRTSSPQGGTPEQRFAWAANCRYARR